MMPLYEYRCGECNFQVELLQSMGARAPKCCNCDALEPMKKLISATSFALKGSGWAKDNYGLKNA